MQKPLPFTPGEYSKLWAAWRRGVCTAPSLAKVIGRGEKFVMARWRELIRYISRQEKGLVKRQRRKSGSATGAGRPLGDRKYADHPLLTPDTLRMAGVAGYTVDQVAKMIGCSKHTLNNYLREKPALRAALTDGRHRADLNVVNAFYKRATGMKIKDTKFATHQGRILDEKEYDVELAPDVEAGKFWLVNRMPEAWSRAPVPMAPDSEKTEYDIREGLYEEESTDSA